MVLEVSDDAALVLLDLLGGYGEEEPGYQLPIRHAAERNALWLLEAALEHALIAQFQPDYGEQLAAARRRLEDAGGPW